MIPDKVKILIDMCIGDGHINKRKNAKNSYQFEITQGEKQFEYLRQKRDVLESYGYTTNYHEYFYEGRTKNTCNYGRVRFCADEAHTAYKYTYNERKKTLDKALFTVLDRRSLAYWFYDDGTTYARNIRKKGKYVYVFEKPWAWSYSICVAGFNLDGIYLARDWMYEKFAITATVRGGKFPIIAISNNRSKDIFKALIEDYVSPDLRYKIMHPHSRIGIPFERYTIEDYHRNRLSETAPST